MVNLNFSLTATHWGYLRQKNKNLSVLQAFLPAFMQQKDQRGADQTLRLCHDLH